MSLYLCLTLPKYWLLLLLWNETGLWLFLRVVVVISRTKKKHYQIISVVCLYFVLPRICWSIVHLETPYAANCTELQEAFQGPKEKAYLQLCYYMIPWDYIEKPWLSNPKKMQTSFSPYTTILSLLTTILLLFLFQNEMCPAQWIPQAVTATPHACGFYGMVRATLAG